MLKIGSSLLIVACFVFAIFSSTLTVRAQELTPQERAKLEQELKDLQAEADKLQKDLDNKVGERKTMESELSIITSKIAQSKNKIAQTNTQLKKISGDINVREKKIKNLTDQIERNKAYITDLLAEMRKLDDIRATVAFSKDETFADVFQDVGDYRSIQGDLSENVDGLKTNKKFVEVEKEQLIDKKDETEALKRKQEQDKKEEEARSKEKKDLISISKQQEKDFQKVIADKQKKVAEIKAKLFSFAGGQTAAIPFASALQYAQLAETQTGTPAAFTLAILMQESALGANVGKCYLTDTNSGAGINIKTSQTYSNVMKPSRDVPPFLDITSGYGLDWKKTVVSCPIAGAGGWGGAMGPAQFIASTWKSTRND
jgi:septal ring factor EnvC (AmiA/AmiB activator)